MDKRRLPRLSLDLLRGFRVAARHLSFTRAAQELFVTQSAISREVKTLEEQIGQPLFHRTHRDGCLAAPCAASPRRNSVRSIRPQGDGEPRCVFHRRQKRHARARCRKGVRRLAVERSAPGWRSNARSAPCGQPVVEASCVGRSRAGRASLLNRIQRIVRSR
jgi:hypothetical protein